MLEKDEESTKMSFASFNNDMQSLNKSLASKLKEIKDIVSVVFCIRLAYWCQDYIAINCYELS